MKTNEEIRAFLLKLICEVDYDIYKSYLPEMSEDPEMMEADMKKLIGMVQEVLNENG